MNQMNSESQLWAKWKFNSAQKQDEKNPIPNDDKETEIFKPKKLEGFKLDGKKQDLLSNKNNEKKDTTKIKADEFPLDEKEKKEVIMPFRLKSLLNRDKIHNPLEDNAKTEKIDKPNFSSSESKIDEILNKHKLLLLNSQEESPKNEDDSSTNEINENENNDEISKEKKKIAKEIEKAEENEAVVIEDETQEDDYVNDDFKTLLKSHKEALQKEESSIITKKNYLEDLKKKEEKKTIKKKEESVELDSADKTTINEEIDSTDKNEDVVQMEDINPEDAEPIEEENIEIKKEDRSQTKIKEDLFKPKIIKLDEIIPKKEGKIKNIETKEEPQVEEKPYSQDVMNDLLNFEAKARSKILIFLWY